MHFFTDIDVKYVGKTDTGIKVRIFSFRIDKNICARAVTLFYNCLQNKFSNQEKLPKFLSKEATFQKLLTFFLEKLLKIWLDFQKFQLFFYKKHSVQNFSISTLSPLKRRLKLLAVPNFLFVKFQNRRVLVCHLIEAMRWVCKYSSCIDAELDGE